MASRRGELLSAQGSTFWLSERLIDGEFQRPRNGRKNDKAHPPIHPTAAAVNLEADERRVYELVTRRFLASCHSNAEGKQTTVEIEIAEEKFFTTGECLPYRRAERALMSRAGDHPPELPRGVPL